MRTGTPSVKPFTKGVEGEEWEALYCHCRELKQATGAEKAERESKGESPLGNDSGEGQIR